MVCENCEQLRSSGNKSSKLVKNRKNKQLSKSSKSSKSLSKYLLPSIALFLPESTSSFKFTPYDQSLTSLHFSKNVPTDSKAYDLDTPLTITSPADPEHKYNCYTPRSKSEIQAYEESLKNDEENSEENPDSEQNIDYESPYYLIEHLFKDDSDCYLMADGYWMYEICFNKYIRQFHEDRVQKGKINVKSHYMGKKPVFQKNGPLKTPVPKTYYDKTTYPFYAVVYESGDVCDVTKKPRKTTVQLTCDLDYTGTYANSVQIMSMQETASCEYEFLVAVGAICQHPLFQRETEEQKIVCVAGNEKTPSFPAEAARLNSIGLKGRKVIDTDQTIVPAATTVSQQEAGASQVNIKDNVKNNLKGEGTNVKKPNIPSSDYEKTYGSLQNLLKDFVTGESCLHGGSGWWRYEYCFGQYVKQFHEDANGRTDIILGNWDLEAHKEWAEGQLKLGLKNSWYKSSTDFKMSNKPKLPKFVDETTGKTMVANVLMKNGDVCDLTKQPRSVYVRHICNQNTNKVNMILHEPGDCEYVLNVESRAFCDYLQDTDELALTPELENMEQLAEEKELTNMVNSDVLKSVEKTVDTIVETAEQATANILKHLEAQLNLEGGINPEQVQIKLNGGQKMVINADELKKILNDPEKLKEQIKAHMEGKVESMQVDSIETEKLRIGGQEKGGSIADKSRPNFRKLPEIVISETLTEKEAIDLEEAIMSYNDVVEEIVEYIEDEEEALLNGVKTIEQVLTQHNARLLTDFYEATNMLLDNGQLEFGLYRLRDLLAYLYEDTVLLTELTELSDEIDYSDDEIDEDDDEEAEESIENLELVIAGMEGENHDEL